MGDCVVKASRSNRSSQGSVWQGHTQERLHPQGQVFVFSAGFPGYNQGWNYWKGVWHGHRVPRVAHIVSRGVSRVKPCAAQNPQQASCSQGTLALQGTVVRPTDTRFMTLQCTKSSILCEDVFTAVVVFSSGTWQGADGSTTLPPKLAQAAVPLSTFSAGCGKPIRRSTEGSTEGEASQPQASSPSRPAGRRACRRVVDLSEDALAEVGLASSQEEEEEDDLVPDSDVEEVLVQRAALLSAVTPAASAPQGTKRPAVAPSSGEDSSGTDEVSDAAPPPPAKRARRPRGAPKARVVSDSSGTDSSQGDSSPVSSASEGSDDDYSD